MLQKKKLVLVKNESKDSIPLPQQILNSTLQRLQGSEFFDGETLARLKELVNSGDIRKYESVKEAMKGIPK